MKKDVFKNLITDFQEREFTNVIPREINLPVESNKIVSLIGVRRSGKTFTLYDLINRLRSTIAPENIVYINFEDDRLFPCDLNDLSVLLESYYELHPKSKQKKVYFLFDELHNVENWEKFIRRLYDNENCQIFLTGSSSKFLSKEISTSLRGRTISYEIFPLSFKEFLQFKEIKINLHSSRTIAEIKNAFSQHITYGSFPETVNQNEEIIKKTLKEYIDLIIYRDIIDRFKITNTFLLKFLVKYFINNISTSLSFHKLYNDFKSQGIHLSKNTIYEYVSYLEDAYIFFSVPKFSFSHREQLRNPKKIYTVDIGFKSLFGIKEDIGNIYENIVFLHLRRKYNEIYYFKNKQEVDFCIVDKGHYQLINVCYDIDTISTRQREINGLLEAMNFLKIKQALLINSEVTETVAIENKQIKLIPLWKWLLISI
jgi:predicted AAA+ superfamily ATPase